MNELTIEMLKEALRGNPGDWKMRVHVAGVLQDAGRGEEARRLLREGGESWPTGETGLEMARVLRGVDGDWALRLCDELVRADKAFAGAYLLKAWIYRDRGLRGEARTNYNLAAVIEEALEDEDFEAWLAGGESPQVRKEAQSLPQGNSGGADEWIDLFEEDDPDFVETEALLDDLAGELIDFSAIGGMEALKERIRMSIIYPFKNKELFAKFKKKTGGGLLLYGPPGCGKTLISRATAGECGAHFISVSIHDVLSKWIGESERRVHELFQEARRKAPTILFIDEIDALGVKRGEAGNTASLVNTLLTEIDGASSRNEDVLVLGATNTPWRLDSAFRRPGRFDHVIFVPPPDAEARESIFRLALDGIPQEKIEIKALAKASAKFSGADIRAVVERASERVIERIMKTGKEQGLTQKELLATVKKHRPTTVEWLEQATNFASFANQSGLYDELAEYLRGL